MEALERTIWQQAPHGLICQYNGYGEDYTPNVIVYGIVSRTLDKEPYTEVVFLIEQEEDADHIQKFTPHLFSFDYLTKPIRVEGVNEGKEFVPLMVIFEMIDDSDWIEAWTVNREKYSFQIDDEWNHVMIIDDELEVFYNSAQGSIGMYFEGEYLHVSNQQDIFEFMDKCHFNVYDLPADQYINAAESGVYNPK